MKLTNRQKSGAAVAVVCVTALAVDKLILAPPSGASASPAPAVNAAAPALPAPPVEDPNDVTIDGPTPRALLAERFESLAAEHGFDSTTVPDAFQAPAHWQPDETVDVPEVPDSAEAADFRAKHRLTACMANGGGGIAVINGRGYRVGAMVDGYKLLKVEERSVVLDSGTTKVHLTIDE
ncbi:MAG: hypothetical protein ACYTGP_02060 [Planctomycetota bacterium]